MNDDPRIDPADLRNVRFPGSSRRYDARAVDQFLETVASRIAATNDLVDELRRELFAAREEPQPAPAAPAPAPAAPQLSTLDDDDLVRLVGEETASVLSTARRAAEEIRSKAEEAAARMIREATAEADQVTEGAETRAAELTASAEQALEQATAAAEADAARIREEAEADAERRTTEAREQIDAELAAVEERKAEAETEAARLVEEARDEGRGMVAEAKEVRTRILEDLQRRRDLARDQIERLLDGRERLLEAYARVRENLDDITGQLLDSLPHPDEEPEPELPDGFAGIVGAGDHADDADDAGAPVDAGGAVVEVEVDDTVAPAPAVDEADGVRDTDGAGDADDTSPHAPTETEADEAELADESADVDVEDEADEASADGGDEAVGDDAPTETEADEAEQHEDAGTDGGDVDALFARLRAERQDSVTRAQEVLDSDVEDAGDATADATADGTAGEGEVDDQAEVADDEHAEVDVADDEQTSGDVDRVPTEFLADEADLAVRTEALGPIDARLNRALKRRLADEQNELLDLLRRSGSTDAGELLPTADTQIDGYAGVAQKHLAAAAAAGAEAAGRTDVEIDVSSLAGALGATLAEPFRRRFERSAADVDGDADELDERLRALYREWKVQHIAPAAEDALLSAYALGTLTAAQPDGRVRWRIDPQQGPCPDAQDNALEGAVAAGDAFPTGDACPQAHPGCRCLLVVE